MLMQSLTPVLAMELERLEVSLLVTLASWRNPIEILPFAHAHIWQAQLVTPHILLNPSRQLQPRNLSLRPYSLLHPTHYSTDSI